MRTRRGRKEDEDDARFGMKDRVDRLIRLETREDETEHDVEESD